MAPERRQGEDALAVVRAARQLHRALQVLARLLGVADAAEHAAEDAVGAAGGARLAEPLGQPQRLLRRVDGEHVVPGVEVEPGGLLVEAHQLDPRRAVLQQVDAALVVLDRRPALALVGSAAPVLRWRSATRSRSSCPRCQSRHSCHTRIASSTRPSRSDTSPSFSRHAHAHGQVLVGARRRARGGSGRRPRGSSRGAPRRRRPPPGSARPARASGASSAARERALAARATRRGRSARPAAPPPRRSGRPRAPR